MMADDQTSLLLSELSDFDARVDRCLDRLISQVDRCSECGDFNSVGDSKLWSNGQEQDSAPENDQALRHSPNSRDFFLGMPKVSKIDIEPLRALLTQRMDAHRKCFSAFDQELSAFRAYLNELLDFDSLLNSRSRDQNERSRLEARIHQLEVSIFKGA